MRTGFIVSVLLAACTDEVAVTAPADPAVPTVAAVAKVVPGELVTLFAHDPLTQTYSFSAGRCAAILQDGQVRSLGAQLEFSHCGPTCLSVVGSGGDQSVIIKVPSLDDKSEATYYELRREGDAIRYEHADTDQARQGMSRIDLPKPTTENSTVDVSAGDICLIRIEGLSEPLAQLPRGATAYIKLLVLEMHPGQSVTFKWDLFSL